MRALTSGPAGRGRDGDLVYRPGRTDDLLPTVRVFKRAINELYRRHNLPQAEAPDVAIAPLHGHFLRTDARRFWVAESAGEVVGFGAGLVRGDWWYLAALFVDPGLQSRGVGRTLIEHARAGVPPSVSVEATITDGLQPISNTLFARHGLIPTFPVLGMAGKPKASVRTALPRGAEVVSLDLGLLDEVREIDRCATGLDRTPDHAYLQSADGARQGWLLRRGDRAAGYVYTSERGAIGPAASTGRGDMTALIRLALVKLREAGAENAYAAVPGPNADAQRVLLEAGLVYDACPGLILASRPFGRFDRYVIANYGLM